MIRSTIVTVLFLATALAPAYAHGPTPKKVEESISISAPVEKVWETAGAFGEISKWHPDVSKSSADKGNEPGSVRELTLEKGVIKESLDEYDAAAHSYSYRMDGENLEALPVSSYSATMTVEADGDGSKVSWIGRFYRGDTSNEPPENLNDESAIAAMTAIYKDGLAGLKKTVEGK
ncbi:MAG: SRPBCC family protein [Advenella sp.]|uniref:SRPBCC family protein n=1 Tax=unclassified Advenella TaxID=2685285 RepID=UPI001D01B138|nr:SRPBCC family protein [Advenella sp. FME57]